MKKLNTKKELEDLKKKYNRLKNLTIVCVIIIIYFLFSLFYIQNFVL